MVATATDRDLKVKSILISQPKPENLRSPYFELARKFKVKIDFRKFIHVEEVSIKEFRKSRVELNHYSAVILTSRNAIDHFFRICGEMRVHMSQNTKYFCQSEAIALYLQKYIQYRKRKVFYGNGTFADLTKLLLKYKEGEKILLTCSKQHNQQMSNFLKENSFDFKISPFYQTVSSDLTDLENITYDILVFFSPLGLKSLFENFPNFKQNKTRIAVFGNATKQAALDAGLVVDIEAPIPEAPSMTMSLEQYLKRLKK